MVMAAELAVLVPGKSNHWPVLKPLVWAWRIASLAETVGIFWFWKPSEVMI